MSKIRIVHNCLLQGWFVVRGKHQFPLGGPFDSKDAASDWLHFRRERCPDANIRPEPANAETCV